MGVKEKADTIDIIEKKRLKWYDHVGRMPEERIPNLIMEWIPRQRRKRRRPRKTWMEGVQAAVTTRNLEPDQWINEKYSNIKFHNNPSIGSRVVPCGQPCRKHKTNSNFAQFCERA
jgi:hypothetical protein